MTTPTKKETPIFEAVYPKRFGIEAWSEDQGQITGCGVLLCYVMVVKVVADVSFIFSR